MFRPSIILVLNFKILHTLGLLHEHQRPDREDHIDIDMASVPTGLFHDFKMAGFLEVNNKTMNKIQKFQVKTFERSIGVPLI